jgi:hypothetical protein
LTAPHEREIGFARDIIRSVAEHLHDNVCGAEYGGAIGHDLRALFDVDGVWVASLLSGSGFHNDFESRLDEARDGDWNQRNPTLAAPQR